jgi:hypothetical protein
VSFVLIQQHECDFDSCDGTEETMGAYTTAAEAQAAAEIDAEGAIDWQPAPGAAVYLSGYPADKSGDPPDFWEYVITEGGTP